MDGQTAVALAELLHADQALLRIYDDALGRVTPETSSALQEAMQDHARHEKALAAALEETEMQSVEPGDDVRALMEEHGRQIRQARDEHEVLNVLMLAEQFNAALYESAEREGLPEELSEIIADQHADERLHASLIAERVPYVEAGHDHNIACMTGGLTDDKNPDDFD